MIPLRINMDMVCVCGQLDLFQPKERWKMKMKTRNSPRRFQNKNKEKQKNGKTQWPLDTIQKYEQVHRRP